MVFNKENHAKNLPDTYRKDNGSNNYKILEIERVTCEKLRTELQDIYNILDLDNATGSTLDMYGERVGQLRGNATDAQYIIMIKAKIMRNMANGSYKSICDAVCATFGCEKSDILFEETSAPCTIKATVFPVVQINEAGFTATQALAILRSLLPVCITLEPIMIGSFCFAEGEGEIDTNAGFTDIEGGTTGGTFSVAFGADDETTLPI
jgi:hypothetical protein